MGSTNKTIWRLGIAVLLIQLFDIAIHVAADQVEPIRIAANIIIGAWIGLVFWGNMGTKFAVISQTAMSVYILLNIVFLNIAGTTNPAQNGAPRIMLFALVTITTVLTTWLYTVHQREAKQEA